MTRFIVLGFLLVGAVAAQAQQAQAPARTTTRTRVTRSGPSVAAQLTELRQALNAQQQQISQQQLQIRQLGDQVQARDQRIQQLEQKLDQSQALASSAAAKADSATQKQEATVAAFQSDINDLKQNQTNTAVSVEETQSSVMKAIESPLALHFKGITITPGGFLAAETVWRNKALGADINTPFNSITMPGAAQAHMSEFFGSGRQSRVSMLAEGKLKDATLTGYVEADFLSAGVTSNNNQSNSYTLRQRQTWGQAALSNGFTFTGGQMWSLVTETKKGLDNRTEAPPMVIDPQYNVGFSWARQFGFRVTKNFANRFWLGASVENAQTLFAAQNVVNGSQNFLLGSAGASGGLYNPSATYSFNSAPDFIFKAAAEPGIGHFEAFAVVRRFRDRVYPNLVGGFGAFNFATATAGYGANARISILKKRLDIGGHFLGGDGMGRYGTASLPDVTVNPDGTLATLKSAQGLATVEVHTGRLDLYFNGGGEFVGRHALPNAAGKFVGYGDPLANNTGCYTEQVPGQTPTGGQFPTSTSGFLPGALLGCPAITRNIIEGTAGFWYRFYKGPRGTLQWGAQYSYLVRNTWSGFLGNTVFGQPRGLENMVLTSFRYYLP